MNRKAKVISLANNKGGSGKTCTAVNLSASLMRKGKKVLAIDMDGQCNLTWCIGAADLMNGGIYEAFRNGAALVPSRLQAVGKGCLDIVPGCRDMAAVSTDLANSSNRALVLSQLLEGLKDQYDYILIDAAPETDLLLMNALFASDAVIIPMMPEPLHLRGAANIVDIIGDLDKSGKKLDYRVLITQQDRRRSICNAISDNAKTTFAGKIFYTEVRKCVAAVESTALGQDLFAYAPKCTTAADYSAVSDSILQWKL